MITENEYREVIQLKNEKSAVQDLLRGFESQYVASSVGIVDINSAAKREPKPSDSAAFFHNHFAGYVKELNQKVVAKMQHRVKEIDLELSKYIQREG